MREPLVQTATKRDPRRRRASPRRRRFGLAWLIVLVGFGAWAGFGPSGQSIQQPAGRPLGTVAATDVSPGPRTKRIADVVVGDRVKSENPTGEEDLSLGAEVNPAGWRKLVLRASKRDGGWADVELLRPLSWIEERKIRPGGSAPISVPECGIDGDADVLAIEPCAPITPGNGRVVTGTFHHSSSRVLDLELEGLPWPIVTTVNHLFWSADRSRFVRADQLRRGENLRGRDGLMGVLGATPRRGTVPVYNLEVHVDHVYHVSAAGVLVHNGNPCGPLIGIPNATRLTVPEQATAARLQAQSGLKLSESPHIGAEYVDQFGKTYDQIGNPRASQFWNEKQFLESIDDHLLKSNDFTVIDLTGFAPNQIDAVRKYIDSLAPAIQAKIIRVGF